MMGPEYYRRRADLAVEAARCISMYPDRDKLLAFAQSLREQADLIEAERCAAKESVLVMHRRRRTHS